MPDHTDREREAVDGARDAFEERVRWFYANAPECQEARRHSFSRQRDMAFVLARNEDRAAVRAAVLAEVRAEFNRDFSEQAEHEWDCDMADCSCDKDIQSILEIYNERRRDFLAALTALEVPDA